MKGNIKMIARVDSESTGSRTETPMKGSGKMTSAMGAVWKPTNKMVHFLLGDGWTIRKMGKG